MGIEGRTYFIEICIEDRHWQGGVGHGQRTRGYQPAISEDCNLIMVSDDIFGVEYFGYTGTGKSS